MRILRMFLRILNRQMDGVLQGAYNSVKPGKPGKLREFKIYSGNLSDACCFFCDTIWNTDL